MLAEPFSLSLVIAPLSASIFVTAQAIVAPTTAILDDRGTLVVAPSLRMRWHQLVPGRGFDNAVLGRRRSASTLRPRRGSVGARESIWRSTEAPGQRSGPTGPLAARFFPGSVISGGRALVFAGVVRSAAISDTLEVTLTTDGRQLTVPAALNFQFQIEAEQ